jgi:hypothetical protein
MFIAGEFKTAFGEAIADKANCPERSPGHAYICTLEEGHSGNHIAGVDLSTYAAYWDDDRSTDPKDKFFETLGL